jgi:hypothetical protein
MMSGLTTTVTRQTGRTGKTANARRVHLARCRLATSLRPLIGADTRSIAQGLAMGEIGLRLTIA